MRVSTIGAKAAATAASATRGAAAAARCFSASSAARRLFELRTYSIKPKFMPTFIAATNEHIHVR